MKIGSNDVSKLYLGGSEIGKVYLGTTQVYGGSQPQPTPYDEQYLTLDIISSGTIVWKNEGYSGNKTISYSFDSGSTWNNITANRTGRSFNVNAGDKVMLKGNNEKYCNDDIRYFHHFIGTATFNIEGNIMSLISGDSFTSATTLSDSYTFGGLFENSSGLTNAENLILPATTLAKYCYESMFNGCTNLTSAPQLPATTLAEGCYWCMFQNCTSLNYIKCLATNILAANCTTNWVGSVSGTGTFVKAASMSSWTTGVNGIPDGWTVENDDGSFPYNDLQPDNPIDNGDDIE